MPNDDTDEGQPHAMPDYEFATADAVRAQGHADAHLLGALLDGIGHQAVDADGGEQQRDRAEDGQQQHVEALRAPWSAPSPHPWCGYGPPGIPRSRCATVR